MLRKLFRPKVTVNWNIIEKESVDEIIFRTTKIRNRLILELMARGGMRIGEVLKLRLCDTQIEIINKNILIFFEYLKDFCRLICWFLANIEIYHFFNKRYEIIAFWEEKGFRLSDL